MSIHLEEKSSQNKSMEDYRTKKRSVRILIFVHIVHIVLKHSYEVFQIVQMAKLGVVNRISNGQQYFDLPTLHHLINFIQHPIFKVILTLYNGIDFDRLGAPQFCICRRSCMLPSHCPHMLTCHRTLCLLMLLWCRVVLDQECMQQSQISNFGRGKPKSLVMYYSFEFPSFHNIVHIDFLKSQILETLTKFIERTIYIYNNKYIQCENRSYDVCSDMYLVFRCRYFSL